MDALILAGGLGTRLRAVVPDLPKPMAPLCGRPFLEILLGSLRRKGVTRAVLSLGYMADTVVKHFGPRYGTLEIAYEIEDRPLGTGGAIFRGLKRCTSDAVLVVNGDTFLDIELHLLTQAWAHHQRPMIVGVQAQDTARYGRLEITAGRLSRFVEKGIAGPGLINTGHYVLPRWFFDGIELPESFSFESDLLAPRLSTLDMRSFETQGRFIDIGVPEDYARAQTELRAMADLT